MLVLSRKVGEQIIVNDNICVTAVRGNRIQLKFSAPRDVSIRRQELERYSEGERENLRQPGLSAGIANCGVSQ